MTEVAAPISVVGDSRRSPDEVEERTALDVIACADEVGAATGGDEPPVNRGAGRRP